MRVNYDDAAKKLQVIKHLMEMQMFVKSEEGKRIRELLKEVSTLLGRHTYKEQLTDVLQSKL